MFKKMLILIFYNQFVCKGRLAVISRPLIIWTKVLQEISALEASIGSAGGSVTGDYNAKSPQWRRTTGIQNNY